MNILSWFWDTVVVGGAGAEMPSQATQTPTATTTTPAAATVDQSTPHATTDASTGDFEQWQDSHNANLIAQLDSNHPGWRNSRQWREITAGLDLSDPYFMRFALVNMTNPDRYGDYTNQFA